jgi:hypothetical protein
MFCVLDGISSSVAGETEKEAYSIEVEIGGSRLAVEVSVRS